MGKERRISVPTHANRFSRSSVRMSGIVVALVCWVLGSALMAASSRADPLSTGAGLDTGVATAAVDSPPSTNADVGSTALDTQAPAVDSTGAAIPDPVSGGAPEAGSTSGGSSSATSSDSQPLPGDSGTATVGSTDLTPTPTPASPDAGTGSPGAGTSPDGGNAASSDSIITDPQPPAPVPSDPVATITDPLPPALPSDPVATITDPVATITDPLPPALPSDPVATITDPVATITDPQPPAPVPSDPVATVTDPLPSDSNKTEVVPTGSGLGDHPTSSDVAQPVVKNVLPAAPPPAKSPHPTVPSNQPARISVSVLSVLVISSFRGLGIFPAHWLVSFGYGVGRPADTASPSGPRQPVPQTPGGMAGVAGISASALLLSGFAALLVLFSAAFPQFTRRLGAVSAPWRPLPLLSLLERPG
jgi:hypothetical protein